MLSVQKEQRVNIKFCFKLGKSASETFVMLQQVYGDDCLSRTQVFEWFKRFKDGREDTSDDTRTGRPLSAKTDANIEKIYISVLATLRERVRRKRNDLWRKKSWTLHQDNAPAHSALSVKTFLAKHNIPILDHPPYSPDLAPCDFFLFPKVKSALKGTRFETVEAVKEKATEVMYGLTENDLQHCYEQWKIRMERCRDRGGEYIEGDNMKL